MGDPVYQKTLYGYTGVNEQVNLQAGYSYVLELTVKGGSNNGGSFTLLYDTANQDYFDYVDQVVSGVRLEQIRFTDSVAGISHSKYYRYATLENTGVSSGMGGLDSGHNVGTSREIMCDPATPYISEIAICTGSMYTSGAGSLFNFEGSHIYYSHILESDDPNFVNGGTEYVFYPPRKAKRLSWEGVAAASDRTLSGIPISR